MSDAATRLAGRLERLDSHLAIVLSVHLFVEHLLDRLIDEKSEIADRILKDHRTYTFSVKLSLVFHMGLLERNLFDNLAALNSLRNTYAHEIDVDLAQSFDKRFVRHDGEALFADLAATMEWEREQIRASIRGRSGLDSVQRRLSRDVDSQRIVATGVPEPRACRPSAGGREARPAVMWGRTERAVAFYCSSSRARTCSISKMSRAPSTGSSAMAPCVRRNSCSWSEQMWPSAPIRLTLSR